MRQPHHVPPKAPRLRVLLVEENSTVRSLLAEFLESCEFDVTARDRSEGGETMSADLLITGDRPLVESHLAALPERVAIFLADAGTEPPVVAGSLVLRKPFRLSTFARAIENRRELLLARRLERGRLARFSLLAAPLLRVRDLFAVLHESFLGYALLVPAVFFAAWFVFQGTGGDLFARFARPDAGGIETLKRDPAVRDYLERMRREITEEVRREAGLKTSP